MEVTSKSFQEKLPSIIEAIRECEFCAIDTECGGFALNLRDEYTFYDTIETRYERLKFLCQNHLAWQIGLSIFKYDPFTNSYQCRTYTFNVFPADSPTSKRSYIMTSNALDFLNKRNFPFLKVITEGIVII